MDDLSTDELILEFDLARMFFAEEEEEEEEEASYVVSLKDITERKRAEEQIEILSRFPAENPNPVLRIAPDGAILYANDASEQLLAIWNAQIGQVVPDDYRMQIEEVAKSGQKKEIEVRCGQGVFSCILAPVVSIGYVNVYGRDITERKRTEEALLLEKENFRRSLDESPLGVRIVTADGDTLYANRAILDLYGYDSLEELQNTPLKDHYTPESYAEFQKRKQERQRGDFSTSEYEISIVRTNGEVRHLQVHRKEVLWNNAKQFLVMYQDVTDRKLAEQALRESEERFRGLFENAFEGIYRSTQEGKLLIANPALVRMLGYASEEELLSIEVSQLYINPDDRGRLTGILEEEGEVRNFELNLKRKDGQKTVVLENARTVRDGQGSLLYYEGTLTDVTERKRAEEALAESERKLRTLFEILPVGVSILNAQRKIVYVNPALERILDISKESLFKGDYGSRTYLRPDGTLMPAEEFASVRAIKEQRAVHNVDTGVVKEDGTVIWTSVSAVPLGSPDWDVLVVTSDITERKRADEALHVSLEKYRVLFESFPLGITISDKSGKIIEVNRQSERLLGITRDAHAQRRINSKEWQIVRKDGTPMPVDEFASTRALQENRLIENVEMGIVKDKGEITWINVTAAPMPLKDYGVAIAYGDITDRKLAEARLKTTQEQLHLLAGHLQSVREEERKHLSQEFHDQLGQVLTALKMDLSMLHRTLADPGRELSRTAMALGVESMQGMIDRAIGIIREILSELRPEMLDQLGIVPTLEWEAERFQRHSGISCTFNSTVEDIGLDAKKSIALYRILQEAVTNVARHAKATSVEVTLRKEGDDLILEIKDNGIGISADAEQKTRSFGLIGMRERAILLGGTLEIRGVEGRGTTILVRIPYE